MRLEGETVLVTGAAGFIGSHLVEGLVARGATVRAFVRYNSHGTAGSLDHLPRETRAAVTVVAGDLKDPSAVLGAVDGCAAVFHLGALIGIPYSYVHPVDYIQTNVVGTSNVLEAVRRCGTPRLVPFSTSEVYGTARYAPIDEEHPLQGQSPYSASKIAADQTALSYHRSFGTPVAICRPFNTYGPRQPTRAIIPTILFQALTGDRLRLGSLDPTRDLNFVSDTVEGAIRIAETDAAVGEVINLGTGREISIGDLVRLALEIVGRPDMPVETDPARVRPAKSEVERLIADASKAERLLGWTATVGIAEGLERTADWVRKNVHLFAVKDYHV